MILVAVLIATIFAPATAAPEGSVTWPDICARYSWANASVETTTLNKVNRKIMMNLLTSRFIWDDDRRTNSIGLEFLENLKRLTVFNT